MKALSASQAWALAQLAKAGHSGKKQSQPLFEILNGKTQAAMLREWGRKAVRAQARLDCKTYYIPIDASDTWFGAEFPKQVSEEDYFTLKRWWKRDL